MVKWNGKRDVVGLMALFLFPALAAIVIPIIMISPLLILVYIAMASVLGYFIFKKRKH